MAGVERVFCVPSGMCAQMLKAFLNLKLLFFSFDRDSGSPDERHHERKKKKKKKKKDEKEKIEKLSPR